MTEYREIPVDWIAFSPFNTRGEVSEEELQSLAETLKQSHGNDVQSRCVTSLAILPTYTHHSSTR